MESPVAKQRYVSILSWGEDMTGVRTDEFMSFDMNVFEEVCASRNGNAEERRSDMFSPQEQAYLQTQIVNAPKVEARKQGRFLSPFEVYFLY
jgi:hypothetical protein